VIITTIFRARIDTDTSKIMGRQENGAACVTGTIYPGGRLNE
jgi:hypothetical protein